MSVQSLSQSKCSLSGELEIVNEKNQISNSAGSLDTLGSISKSLPITQAFNRFKNRHLTSIILTLTNECLIFDGKDGKVFSLEDILGATVKETYISKWSTSKVQKNKGDMLLYELGLYFFVRSRIFEDASQEPVYERKYKVK